MKIQSLAHTLWAERVQPGDSVIDATVGNGYDTLFLARLLQGKGRLYGYDIQLQAIQKAQELLERELTAELLAPIELSIGSHEELRPQGVKLIVYNLGYLPGGDKSITTRAETTLVSLTQALTLLAKGGMVSVMIYAGHPEGARERELLIPWAQGLAKDRWTVSWHQWINRTDAPGLLIISS